MGNRLKNIWRSILGKAPALGTVSVRRWEAAQTDRLNAAQWSKAKSGSINADSYKDLPTLRARAAYEAANNPILTGVIETHKTSIVGPDGPTLQALTEDTRFAGEFEGIWRDWFALPDYQRQLSGAEMLRQAINMFWVAGEHLFRLVNDKSAPGIQLRLVSIHARRLSTPIAHVGKGRIINQGVEMDSGGRRLAYHLVREEIIGDGGMTTGFHWDRITANNILHLYDKGEPDQVRGVPWLTSTLQAAADLRAYDNEVLDAARMAADFAAVMFTNSPDLEAKNYGGDTVEIERRTISTLPPGWEVQQLNPNQPATNYKEYRNERMREIGRPVDMPLMMVNLDSQAHNYSSARFDGQLFNRGVRYRQGWLGKNVLNVLAGQVAREANLARMLGPVPDDLVLSWTWPVPPHVDPVKEATAEKIRLTQNHTLTFTAACAAHGLDPEVVIAQLKKEKEAFKAAGLDELIDIFYPTKAAPAPTMPATAAPPPKDKENAKPANGKTARGRYEYELDGSRTG